MSWPDPGPRSRSAPRSGWRAHASAGSPRSSPRPGTPPPQPRLLVERGVGKAGVGPPAGRDAGGHRGEADQPAPDDPLDERDLAAERLVAADQASQRPPRQPGEPGRAVIGAHEPLER